MSDLVSPDSHLTGAADVHLRHLLAESIEEPWFQSLFLNIKESITFSKLPPLDVTSKPVAVKDIWGLYGRKKESGLMSLAVHSSVVALLFTTLSNHNVQVEIKKAAHLIAPDISPYLPQAAPKPKTLQGGGGGGDGSPAPASKGRAPKFSPRQFVPPAAVVNNPNPKLLMDPTLIGPVDVQLPNNNMMVWGDPLAKLGPPSNGPGSGGGIGDGKHGGIGPGDGPGIGPGTHGGLTDGIYSAGGSVSAPVVVYRIEPEYSEEARKAKYSGTVMVYIEVDQSGTPRNLKVIKGIGLGLDEQAMEAVSKWRFKPGRKNGKPVTVRAQIEVSFRLL